MLEGQAAGAQPSMEDASPVTSGLSLPGCQNLRSQFPCPVTFVNEYSFTPPTTSTTSYSTISAVSNVVVYTNEGDQYEVPTTNSTIVFTTNAASTAVSTATGCYNVQGSTIPVTWRTPQPAYEVWSSAGLSAAGYGEAESDEERATRESQEAEFRRQTEERLAQRVRANAEAEALLWACLDIVQRGELAINGWFIVTGSSGKRYRIRRGYAGNVEDYEGETIYSYCGHAYITGMPEADQMLAQKFALETDEEGFRRIANATYLRPGTPEEREAIDQGRNDRRIA